MSDMDTKKDNATSHVESKVDKPEDRKEHDNNRNINPDKKNIAASPSRETQQRQDRSDFSPQRRSLATSTSLFVTGFAHAINKTHVERLFAKFGTAERISEFMTSQKSTSTSRYCFVEYDSIESAQKAMDNLHGRTLLRKRLVVLPAHANTEDTSSGRNTAPLNPKKERILIDQKIAALKKKIKESQSH
jgi:RNA recognition motif-containing protein